MNLIQQPLENELIGLLAALLQLVAKADRRDHEKITEFAFDDLSHRYASEDIARIAARIAAGAIGVTAADALQPKPGVYICSEFVDACLQQIGRKINPGCFGFVAPADVAAFCDQKVPSQSEGIAMSNLATRRILVMRHAKKPDEAGDPNLSPAGYARAKLLSTYIPTPSANRM